jgi:monoamine oxidase
LAAAGREVRVVEARGRLGGRVRRVVSASGHQLEAGGELLGLHMASITGLAGELGVPVVPLYDDGAIVRFSRDTRIVEAYPYESDPELAEGHAALAARLDAMAAEVPVEEPWTAARAADWDAQTLASWLASNAESADVRDSLRAEFDHTGATYGELSLLFALWLIHSMGGWETWTMGTTHRLQGGTMELVNALAADLGGRIHTHAAVRRVELGAGRVTVHTDRGAFRCRSVIAALAPQLCARIEWDPVLPMARDRLQDRFLQGHGIKFIAIYDEPWWREEGLSGLGLGLSPVSVALDATGPEHDHGRLVGFVPVTGEVAGRFSDRLTDPQSARALFIEQATRYYGPRAAEAREIHVFNWMSDPWAMGAGVGLPPGVLSTVGWTLREPVGPIHWAGAETGLPQCDWLEGAVASGQRAADEVLVPV